MLSGHKRSLDVATITQGETRFFSVLMLAWGNYILTYHILDFEKEVVVAMLFDVTFDNFISGLVADIDIESEKYRWMGSARIDFYVSKPCNK